MKSVGAFAALRKMEATGPGTTCRLLQGIPAIEAQRGHLVPPTGQVGRPA
jgi:hypothetical protein